MDSQNLEAGHQRTLDMFKAITQSVPGSQLIETYKYFYDAGRCGMTQGSTLLYRDAHHLNINGTLYLGNILATRLTSENQPKGTSKYRPFSDFPTQEIGRTDFLTDTPKVFACFFSKA